MYREKNNGGYRMRASFPITPKQIIGLNAICEKTGLNFSEVCSKALDITLDKYVKEGGFTYPDSTPALNG